MARPLSNPATPMPRGPLQESANAHVWGEVFEWLCGTPEGAFDARNLRAACRKGVVGFDVAVHSGGIAVAAHADAAGATADKESARLLWADGWAPFALRGRAARGGGSGGGAFIVRLELPVPLASGGSFPEWRAPSVVVCETRGSYLETTSAEATQRVAPILASCEATRLSFHKLHPTTTTLGFGALMHRQHLEHIDVSSGLGHITRIQDSFLALAQSLVRLDTAGLEGVVAIDDDFLSCSPSLTSVDLRGLSGVQRIGNSFLSQSRALKAVDTAPLKSLTSIQNGFLFECAGLERFDASGLTAVTSVGDMFLGYCTGLRALDTAGMDAVIECGDDFIAGCRMPADDFVDTAGIMARLGDTMHHNREPRCPG